MTKMVSHPRPGERLVVPGVRAVDERIVAAVERLTSSIEPDVLFRRRLRGEVVNRYVAARERPSPHDGRQRMGRLGRVVLNASVVLALGVSAVGAAAQDALPGVPLYDIKLRLEEIRLRIAPPSVRPVLLRLALDERLEELSGLVATGDWSRVPAAAERVVRSETVLAAEIPGTPANERSALRAAEDVLAIVLATAPDAARPGLERALQARVEGSGGGGPPANAGAGKEPRDGGQGGPPPHAQSATPSRSPHVMPSQAAAPSPGGSSAAGVRAEPGPPSMPPSPAAE